jgi:serralysin
MSANESHYCMCVTRDDLSEEDKVRLRGHKAALLKGAKWDVGEPITVRFLGDAARRFGARGAELEERVKRVALEWTRLANLDLDFRGSGPTDIRIAFQEGDGSWSFLGTMCRRIDEPEPTMNYGWLTPDSPENELRRVVLHEFGHALGLIHEHQNPKGGIRWNEPAVIADLSRPPNNWDLATIRNNMFAKYPQTDVVATDVDAESIMMYPIPRAWTLDGFSADLNA